jgi:hypothetical protein
MHKILIVGFLAAGMTLTLSPTALSQSTGGGTGPEHVTPPTPQGQPGFAAERGGAPVGHRQPTAQDVPQDESKTIDAVDQLDKQLDRKLDICSGC